MSDDQDHADLPADQLTWQPLVLTEEKLQRLWAKLETFPALFDDISHGDYPTFLRSMLDQQAIYYELRRENGDELGLAAAVGVRPGLDAVVHLLCFDRRLKGREALFYEILAHVMDELRLRRLTALIPTDRWTSRVLAKKLGFRKEGCMRQSAMRRGEYRDVEIYGVLREELHNDGVG